MTIKLLDDWRAVLKRAWSVRFNAAATVFGGAEVAVSIWQPESIPHGMFAGIAAFIRQFAA